LENISELTKKKEIYVIDHCKEWEQFRLGNCMMLMTEICLKSHFNTYVGMEKGGRVYAIDHCKEWETFKIERLPNGHVALKSYHGTYLGVRDNAYGIDHCKEWEQFTIEPQPDGTFGFKSGSGNYLTVSPNKEVKGINHCQEWEHFRLTI